MILAKTDLIHLFLIFVYHMKHFSFLETSRIIHSLNEKVHALKYIIFIFFPLFLFILLST